MEKIGLYETDDISDIEINYFTYKEEEEYEHLT